MLSLIDQIKTGRLWDFPGGIHPPENKRQSNQSAPLEAQIPAQIILPLKQHIGKAGDILVKQGDKVLKGQALTCNTSAFMLPIHAPTSGTITAIEARTTAHPSGLSDLCLILEPDFEDQWIEHAGPLPYQQRSAEDLIDTIVQAGISGLGGAGFPTAVKIRSALASAEILVVNAAECEPYITADDVLMRNYAQEIVQGIEIVEHILKPKFVVIGIEDNKPEAVEALNLAAKDKDYIIRVIPTKYPSGGEKQLIKVLTNLEVPHGKHPTDIGILVQNVGSLYAIKRAVVDNEPLIQRLVTLTGQCFEKPLNAWVRIGTPVSSLLNEFGYQEDKRYPRLIMGGPMMGFTLPHGDVPVIKTTNCILAPSARELKAEADEMACIRCGQCAEVCPVSLLPQQLQWHAKAEEYSKCEELNLHDCIECGACAYVCPSDIPLVQYYRQAKAEIRAQNLEAEAAERARQRFEEKKARLEREKEERENRFKQAADVRRDEMKKQNGGEDAIAAAIARVKAQKAQAAGSDNSAPGVKPAVAAAIAKAKAQQEASLKAGASEPDNQEMIRLREERKRLARERKLAQQPPAEPAAEAAASVEEETDPKKAAIAAAIARAKARKQAPQPPAESAAEAAAPAEVETDPKKAAVAAAIARAKARKQAQQQPAETAEESTAPIEEETDPKKAAVAAAIARAKARKQAQQTPTEPQLESPAPAEEETDPKKAAVAAAIARAKARKAAQQVQQNFEEKE